MYNFWAILYIDLSYLFLGFFLLAAYDETGRKTCQVLDIIEPSPFLSDDMV